MEDREVTRRMQLEAGLERVRHEECLRELCIDYRIRAQLMQGEGNNKLGEVAADSYRLLGRQNTS